MSVTTARHLVADELAAGLPQVYRHKPKYAITPNPTNSVPPIEPGRALIVVVRDSFAPAPNRGSQIETVSVWVMVGGVNLNTVEDRLDLAAFEVRNAIDLSPNLVWDDAERAVFADTTHAYRFTVRTITQRTN